MLRRCLLWIENPEAQGHATVFVAKFYGRATLMSFISSVPTNQRSALFQSLLYEAVGRTINPVNGAVGLLWSGNWHLCQLGVEKVLRGGGTLTPLPHLLDHHQGFVDHCSIHHQVVMGFEDMKRSVMDQESKKQSENTTLGSTPHDCPSQRKPLTLFF